jgi:hypothetical protein
MQRPVLLGIAIVFASPLPAFAALPNQWGFELEVRSNLLINDNGYNLPPGSSFNSITADINNNDQVALLVQVVPGDDSMHVWSGAHGNGQLVWAGVVNAFLSDVKINTLGQIVFPQTDSATDGIYVYSPVTGTATRISTLPIIPNSWGSPDINDAGAVGFRADFSSGKAFVSASAGSALIHAGDNGVDPGSSYTFLFTPAFNNARQIAGKVSTNAAFTNNEIRIFNSNGSSVLIAQDKTTNASSPFASFDNSVGINDAGQVAFVAKRAADNRRAVYRSDGTTTVEIAAVDPLGVVRDIEFFSAALNLSGVVAFRGKDANGQAIFAGDGTSLRRVVGKLDVLPSDLGHAQVAQNDSSPVFGGGVAINDRGDIVFTATLTPVGNDQIEWGSGVYVAYADDRLFANNFD